MTWGKEVGDKKGHFYTGYPKGRGRPFCDPDRLASKIKKTTAKSLCPECVDLVGAPAKSK